MGKRPGLIRTKLTPPCVRGDLVLRPRLLRLLDAGLRPECRLILISAPAGYGKSTLAATWLAGRRGLNAWLSLEAAENDPVRFLAYLGAALEAVAPDFHAYGRSLGELPQLPSPETVAAELINGMLPLRDFVVLTLDDYHCIANPYVHALLRFLIQHQPIHFRLMLVTREDPPLALHRLRAGGEIAEVRLDALRFSGSEAAEFLKKMGLPLSETAAAACTERTEGWVAGLQLAALSLQGLSPPAVEDFLQAFSGSHRYIIDYLVEEVLSRQEAGLREFLRRTAVLDRFSAALCNAVTGRADGREMLRQAEERNLFLIPLGPERQWFRYHHLFADSLRAEIGPVERAEVHRRAARWFEERQDLPAAVEQALAAREMDEAARLIRVAAPALLIQGERELASLRTWLEALPNEVLLRNDLFAAKAWAQYLSGHHQEAVAFLASLSAAQRAALPAEEQGRLLSLEANIALLREEYPHAVELARTSLRSIGGQADQMTRAATLNVLSESLARLGDLDGAENALRQVHDYTQTSPGAFIAVVTAANLGSLLDSRGRRREAESLCRRSYAPFAARPGRPPVHAGILAVRLGIMAYEADRLPEARLLLETGLELRRSVAYLEDTRGEETLALTLAALGEREAALEVLRAVERPYASEDGRFALAAVQAELSRRLGEAAAVRRWAEEWRLSAADQPGSRREGGYFTYARFLLDSGRPEPALTLLEGMAARMEAGGRLASLIPCLALQALALAALGADGRAAAELARAVALAAPEAYERALLDQGIALAPLLAKTRECAPAFVDRLVAGLRHAGAGTVAADHRLVEPLTARELELLRLLPEGVSNEEIARRLYISLNTTKWHLKSIFGKLAVGNRVQAVARARELGLVE